MRVGQANATEDDSSATLVDRVAYPNDNPNKRRSGGEYDLLNDNNVATPSLCDSTTIDDASSSWTSIAPPDEPTQPVFVSDLSDEEQQRARGATLDDVEVCENRTELDNSRVLELTESNYSLAPPLSEAGSGAVADRIARARGGSDAFERTESLLKLEERRHAQLKASDGSTLASSSDLSRRESVRLMLSRTPTSSRIRTVLDTKQKRQFLLDFCDSEHVSNEVMFVWRAHLFEEIVDDETRRNELVAVLLTSTISLPESELAELHAMADDYSEPVPRTALHRAARRVVQQVGSAKLNTQMQYSYSSAVLFALSGGELALPSKLVEDFESEGDIERVLGSKARSPDSTGAATAWKTLKSAGGVVTAEVRDGALYGVRAATLIRRSAADIDRYVSTLEHRREWDANLVDARVVMELNDDCVVWWLGNRMPAGRLLFKKRDAVLMRLRVRRGAHTRLVLARSVRHRDVPDKVPGYVRAFVDTSGFVIKHIPHLDACLVTLLVFVKQDAHIPSLMYRKFGLKRAKMLGNIQYLLENCAPPCDDTNDNNKN